VTRDPSGYGGGLNLYAFADNNPVNESDPSGLWPKEGLDTDPFGGSDRIPFPEREENDASGDDEDPGMLEIPTPVDEMGGAAGGLPPSWPKSSLMQGSGTKLRTSREIRCTRGKIYLSLQKVISP
jgi:uncharacterized protein RhaS with RHS repeats